MVKKAQMKIQQMSFMLIATLIFFVLIGMVVLVYSFSGLKQKATDLGEQNAVLLASKIANSPEFSCGNAYGTGSVNCIDMDKLMIVKDKSEYFNFWDVSGIEIRNTYPSFEEDIICDSSNYPNCNLLKLTNEDFKGTAVSNFVSLCHIESMEGMPSTKCNIGKIIIGYEQK